MPLPSPLALVMMSGVTPQCSMPNHLPPVRPQPVCTSSLMKMPPWLRTIFSTIGKYSLGGVTKPPTPWIGSAMKPAIAAAGGRADHVLGVLRALHFAIGIRQAEGAAVAVRVERVHDPRLRRAELPRALAGDPHRHGRAAVVGVAQRHDLGVAGVAARGRMAVSFASVPELVKKDLVSSPPGVMRGDLLRERRLRLIGEDGGDVLERVELLVDFGVHLLVAVADAHGDDAAEEVEILVAVGVPDVLVLGAVDDQRLFVIVEDGGEEEFLIGKNDLVFGHGYAFTRDSYISGRRSRKNCHVLRTSAIMVEVEVGRQHFVLVARGLGEDLAARIAEVALAVELADLPRLLDADAIDGADEVPVGDGVRRLLELPEILAQAGDGRGGVEDDLGAGKAERARALGEVAVVADVDADLGEAEVEDRVPEVAGAEVELLPEAGRDVRDVGLAVLAEILCRRCR